MTAYLRLVTDNAAPPTPKVDALTPEANALGARARAPSTLLAYGRAFAKFAAWCASRGVSALPSSPETVANYLALVLLPARSAVSTMELACSAIGYANTEAGHENPIDSPIVRKRTRGYRRDVGVKKAPAEPMTLDILRKAVPAPDGTLGTLLDRALLLVGFFGCLRRGELCALTVADLIPSPEGITGFVRRSKTDQEGEGREFKLLPRPGDPLVCPVAAVTAWLEAAGIAHGPAFRAVVRGKVAPTALNDRKVSRVVKKYAARAGVDSDAFSGHSLRAGFATSAAVSGAPMHELEAAGGWKPGSKVVAGYVRTANSFKNAASRRL